MGASSPSCWRAGTPFVRSWDSGGVEGRLWPADRLKAGPHTRRAHPSPIDLVSVRESVAAAKQAGIAHFIYLSVAQPAPVMKDYVGVRAEGERLLRESGIPSTFIRPWYVLGPGHRWPYLILPLYWIWMLWPKSRDTVRRLYPVKLRNVVSAIANAVDAPSNGVRVIEQPELGRV